MAHKSWNSAQEGTHPELTPYMQQYTEGNFDFTIGKRLTKTVKMPSKQHQEWVLRKIFHHRAQIPEFCVCKYKQLSFSKLCLCFGICAVLKHRKDVF